MGVLCGCVEDGDLIITMVKETYPVAAKDYPGIPKGTRHAKVVTGGYEKNGPRWLSSKRYPLHVPRWKEAPPVRNLPMLFTTTFAIF